jgi:uncharacterized repeat protein (TIGR01451 family)
VAFAPGAGQHSYPAEYDDALFFADYSRDCIWAMRANAQGIPDPSRIETFVAGAQNPVGLEMGPGGDLFYVDFDGGTIRRIRFSSGNQPPVAVVTATPNSGPAPLDVLLDGRGSSDPEGQALTFAWDIDNDGAFDDASTATVQHTFTEPGVHTVRLRVTDTGGASAVGTTSVSVNSTAPVAVIDSPSSTTTWAVGDTIAFAGHATDEEDGTLPAANLHWSLIMHHCPSTCHTHLIQDFDGVASGSFVAPDHEYPSFLELRLTATDSDAQTGVASVQLNPRTVQLTFTSQPSGLSLTVNGLSQTTSFNRSVIIGSANSLAAPASQTLNGVTYDFVSWSDGGAAAHNVTAGSTSATYSATYQARATADLAMGLTGSYGNGQATYTLTARNLGPSSAQSVVIRDVLASRLSFVSASPGCQYEAASRTVTCQISSLASGAQLSFTLVTSVGRGGKYVDNTATVSSATSDPVTANNSATVRLLTK